MARTWEKNDPKAGLMARKRAQIVKAALRAFLEAGYAAASVNKIAADADVSIKTLYRHYESKDELFSAVMQAACGNPPGESGIDAEPDWYRLPPAQALVEAGREYLSHILLPDQLALYRVVISDAHRFPELGRRYLEATAASRDAIFAGYLDLWAEREGWTVADPTRAGQSFAGLLKVGHFDAVLCGRAAPTADEIEVRACVAAEAMLVLLQQKAFSG